MEGGNEDAINNNFFFFFQAKIKELPLDVVARDEESPTDERPLSSPIAPAILFSSSSFIKFTVGKTLSVYIYI